jgi:DNA polymerase-3 subunit gamma/tau
MDWDPSGPSEPQRTPSKNEPTQAPAPAGKKTPRNNPRSAPAPAASAAASQPDAAPDPWARAVEQAPGVWVIGSETNVGKKLETPPAEDFTSAPAPSYEPATAQIPQPEEVSQPAQVPQTSRVTGLSEADASWGLLPSEAGQPADQTAGRASDTIAAVSAGSVPGGSDSPREVQATPAAPPAPRGGVSSAPEPAEVREYAMASAVAPAAPLQPAPAATASAAAARQSLYQRLSNSPEAEAGRAKAPARTVAALVQDIPSADDETIEESGVFGRAAVERILGGKLIEERSPDGSPAPPRF